MKHWLEEHRADRPYRDHGGEGYDLEYQGILFSRQNVDDQLLLADKGFNNHETNDGTHVSPYDSGRVDYGLDNLEVRLLQGVNEEQFKATLSRTLKATTGIDPEEEPHPLDWEEMMKGGLQSALESQVVIFEVVGASRALTHQLVRTRRAAFHQQSQRATWYGDRPNVRFPMSILASDRIKVQSKWDAAIIIAWEAYKAACDAGVSYQDARYILPEGTTNYIICEYPLREFINTYAYRGCSMFLWEMVGCMRTMRQVLIEAHPFLEPYVKISCEKGELCWSCGGTGKVTINRYRMDATPEEVPCKVCGGLGGNRKCTFQGWENVEKVCDFPWAKQSNRVFLPNPRHRIGG